MTTNGTSPPVELLIAGGGIGGLATSLALARRGVPSCVLEQAPVFGEIGAGIQLAPNALRVFDSLGVLDRVYENAVFPRRAVLMDAVTGQQITAMDFGDPFIARYGYPYVVTHRSDLLDALLDGCRNNPLVTLLNNKRVERVSTDADTAAVVCADGSSYEAPGVIGADGIWSAVRSFTVTGEEGPVFSGDVAYRGAAPIEAVSEAAGLDNVVWWIGPSMHLIQYPIRRGELFNQVAVFCSDRFASGAEEWGGPDELEERFAGMCHYVQEGIKLIGRDRNWALHDRDPVGNWTHGRVTLLGDAAHPMMQYLAQGACQALEDAECLARTVSQHAGDLTTAFKAYQQERLPRTTRVQTWARNMGRIVHADGLWTTVRDELLHRKAADDYRYVDWLYADRGTASPEIDVSDEVAEVIR